MGSPLDIHPLARYRTDTQQDGGSSNQEESRLYLRLHSQGYRWEGGQSGEVPGSCLHHRQRGLQVRQDRRELQAAGGDVQYTLQSWLWFAYLWVPLQPIWRAGARDRGGDQAVRGGQVQRDLGHVFQGQC